MTSMRLAHATPRAVQRMALSCSLGRNNMAIPPMSGRNIMSDNSGNMPLPPHDIVHNNQDDTKQNRQGVVADIAGLQAAQQGACAPQKPAHSSAPTIEHITL